MDAFKESYLGSDSFGIKRFILAHTILFSMEGIPAVYIQNLVGSKNDYNKVKKTGSNRSINRKNWEFNLLEEKKKKNQLIVRFFIFKRNYHNKKKTTCVSSKCNTIYFTIR